MATRKSNKGGKRAPKKAAKPAKPVEVDQGEIRTVKIADILVDDSWNARQHYHAKDESTKWVKASTIEDLAESIKRHGLLQPLIVAPAPETETAYRWDLVAGFRRVKALEHLGVKEAKVRVIPSKVEGADLILLNLTENMQREDLRPHEIAEACFELTQEPFNMKGATIGTRLGLSKPYVNNLIRLRRDLHPEIWGAYCKGMKEADQRTLLKCVGMGADELDSQLAYWHKHLGVNQESEGDGDGESEGGETNPKAPGEKRKRPSIAKMDEVEQAILEARKSGAKSKDWCNAALRTLRWCSGRSDVNKPPISVKGVKNGKGKATADSAEAN